MTQIVDGSGDGYGLKVDSSNRAHTKSTTITETADRSQGGYGYNLNTGEIALTAATASGVAYLKYTGTKKFNISALAVGCGKMGTATDPVLIELIRNPTTGTVIDDATAGDYNENRDFASNNTLSADFYKGAEGKTFTDGDVIAIFYQNSSGRLFAGIDFILGTGSSCGVRITPNDDGTAGNVYVAFVGYETEE